MVRAIEGKKLKALMGVEMMRAIVLLFGITSVLVMLGCGQADPPSATDTPGSTPIAPAPMGLPPAPTDDQGTAEPPTSPDASTAKLEARVEELAQAYEMEDWLKVWSMGSPRSRELCNATDFGIEMTTSQSNVKANLGVGEDAKIKLDVRKVRVEGLLGYIEGDVLVNDTPISPFGNTPSWIYLDGQWWREVRGWEQGCN